MEPTNNSKHCNSDQDLLPPAKRCRVDSSTEPPRPPVQWTQHPDLWLEDGNVILVCGAVGFCVHRGTLSLHSEVFKDMFSLGDSAQDQAFDGKVVVGLPDDADDLYHTLKAMYFRRYGRDESGFKINASVIRIATKYMINELRKDAIEFFTSIFPSSLTSYCTSTVRHSAAELMQAIEIGSQYHVPAILPSATYAAAILPVTATLDLDDHLAVLKAWRNCMISRDQLVSHIEDIFDGALSEIKSPFILYQGGSWRQRGCSTCGLSEKAKRNMERGYRSLRHDVVRHPTISLPLDSFCRKCKTEWTMYNRLIRDSIWNHLPAICGFDDWAAVNCAQRTADRGNS